MLSLALALTLLAPPVQESAPAPTKVFLLAGQSNMEGYTSSAWVREYAPELVEPRDDVWCSWRGACGPLAPGTGYEVGLELSLGRALGERFEAPVLLVKVAVGGTTLSDDWRPPSTVARVGGEIGYLYKAMAQRLRRVLSQPQAACPEALAGGSFELGGFVWLQGESDSFEGREHGYEASLRELIADVRAATATPALPVVVVQINDSGAWDDNGGGGPVVRAAQADVVAADPRAALVVTSDLDPGYHYTDGDHVTIGYRVAQALWPLLEVPAPTDLEALHAAWAEQERLFFPGRGPRPPLPQLHLSDLDWLSATSGWGGDPRRDQSIEGRPLSLDGEAFARGIGTHAESDIVFALEPGYGRFVAVAGLDDEVAGRAVCSVVFQVLIDGEVAVSSPTLRTQERWHFDLPIFEGAEQLTLRVLEADSGIDSDHADWVDCGFIAR
ncbi:NPCBM/NEW2 domain-containing protein [Engelhardtia mirabilis]|uniref:NPCBM/NEW2 domain protein n=1 Tax=Engelhardtia mirabilis TaxID=2528011 RepID=A0A518BGS1_9BACT|nr:NPCBM/NEW2 domain protein [Planctomycetes bacterium Pla133]QDV00483.1 NPCBM/NEW2 domain protein [Planctomycetes bacterium Pla86]